MPTDTVEQPVNETAPAPEADLQGKGGTMEFDAAASLADAFAKLQTGDPAPTPSDEGSADPVGEKGEEGEQGEPAKEKADEAPKPPTAEDLAMLRGKKAPKKEAPADPEEKELGNASDSAKNAFAAMRKDLKAERERASALEAKIAELEKSRAETDPEEVTRLRQLNEEYERELQVARVEATQEFKEAVIAPMSKIRESIGAIAAKYEISESEILTAFAEADANTRADKLSDLAAGMNDRDKFALYDLETRFAKVQGTRDRVVANAKLALEKIEQHRQEQTKAEQEESGKRYLGTLAKAWEEAQGAVPLLNPIEGDDEWNGQLNQAQEFVRSLDFGQLNDDGKARLAIRSAIAPIIYGQFVLAMNELKEAKATLEKYQKATPKAGGGNAAAQQANKEDYDDFMAVLKANLK